MQQQRTLLQQQANRSSWCFKSGNWLRGAHRSDNNQLHRWSTATTLITAAQKQEGNPEKPSKTARAVVPGSTKDKQFNSEQLAFLERKRRFKAGLGPAMPNECPECKGKGTVVCWECLGSGVNHRDVNQIMGSSIEKVRGDQSGVMNAHLFLIKGGPCFMCRGKPECPCRACEGTGITGFDLGQYSGD
ncbi:hypothetical protein OEZ85_012073 [Tetradesmus obliquus]|uniref:Uncharacterized protein n=1 Tax=Tetradesmus obliquus TaxID=3088 RepID=A0ABY8TS91_TETOB|nr:hypothetical protein OEZ85_012073 [Tetradesmus obliquus]